MEPLRQLLAGSPLFFVLQSKCIGYYVSGEFATGGASYVATGRSLAIEHQQHGQSGCLGSAPARLLRLLRACLVAPCSSALPGWAPASGTPAATAPVARASRLQCRRFSRV